MFKIDNVRVDGAPLSEGIDEQDPAPRSVDNVSVDDE